MIVFMLPLAELLGELGRGAEGHAPIELVFVRRGLEHLCARPFHRTAKELATDNRVPSPGLTAPPRHPAGTRAHPRGSLPAGGWQRSPLPNNAVLRHSG
jgi:hypothetical protein